MKIGLFEDEGWIDFLPFTRVRPVWELWWGMDKLVSKWQRYYGYTLRGLVTFRSYLWELYPPQLPDEDLVWLNSRLLPYTPSIDQWIKELSHEVLYVTPEGMYVAVRTRRFPSDLQQMKSRFLIRELPRELQLKWLEHATDLFQYVGEVIKADWQYWQEPSAPLPSTFSVRGKDNVYLHPLAQGGYAYISAEEGPVWIGPQAEIQDGVILQHTNVIGPHTTLLLGAKIRSFNSFGPWCKVGGEVSHSVFLGYANKAHDGFLGHSVIGEWCNIGAGSNTSNLKNTYGPVRLYSFRSQRLENSGLQFCGLLMGDYARCGIQTAFTTGCVVDIFANIVSTGFTQKYIPPFYWKEGEKWEIDKVWHTAERVHARRGRHLSEGERNLLKHLWENVGGAERVE
ncbi:MAG: putative sugar nucleotidyl transferase [Bacteroidia bacterium]|nr:putative sugar nucleotidyl transferase [Bacteroidia bacterium]MDW8134073.1 putative sugar nucleotidyl transferase [Bacteroidia bacterium]